MTELGWVGGEREEAGSSAALRNDNQKSKGNSSGNGNYKG
jgi:hypothetical protein